MKKSKLILFVTLLMLLCLVGFAGCSTQSSTPKKSITFSQTSITANVFEQVNLTPQTENISEKIVWSVSDASVATIDNGLITAKKAGTVNVTASAEGVSATAKITFTSVESSMLILESEYIELELFVGDEVDVDAYVKFNGQVLSGGDFSLSSSNSSIVEITDDGKVKGLEVGETTIKINGTIKGITLNETTIPVTVKEGVELFTGAENDIVTVYISEGAKNQYETTYTLVPTVEIRKQPVANANFNYVVEDSNVITLTNGVIKAKTIGATVVDITYVSAQGPITKKLIVNVLKPSTTILEDEEVLLGINTKNNLNIFGINEQISAISVNGVKSEITIDGNLFAFNSAIQGGLNANVVVYTEKEDFVLKADVYDYIADTKEEFKAFGIATKTKPQTTLALAGNINYEMGNFFTDCGFDNTSTFSGIFDGRGYTIYNIKGNNGLFYHFANATLKNVAFFNVLRDTYNGGGSIVSEMAKDSQNTIENVYVQVKFTVYTGSVLAGFASIANGYFNNVVVHADFASNPNQYNAFAYSFHKGQEPVFENCYVISPNSNGQMFAGVTEGVYADAKSFNEEVDCSVFSTDYWEVANGMLVFRSAKDLILSAYPVEKSINITNTQTEFDGTLIKITTDLSENVSIYLKDEYQGLAIEDGCLVAKNSCVAGNVVVVAEWQHPILGYNVSAEKTFAVKPVQYITEQQTVLNAKNRTDFTYNLSKYNLTDISSVEFNNKTLIFSFNSGVLTIARTEFDCVTANLKITAMDGNSKCVVSIPVESVDYAIGTKAELKAFAEGLKTNLNLVAILTANIDYEGGNFQTDADLYTNEYFAGVLDGKGYAIKNIKGNNGIFWGLKNATIKNIAFVNYVRGTAGGGALANQMEEANVVENVYIQMTTSYTGIYLAGMASICEGTFTNVILEVDFAGNPNTYNAWGRSYNVGKAPVLVNSYAISSNSNGKMFGEVTDGLYTSKDAFKADSATIKANFSDEYWKIDENGILVFKNAVA